LTAGMMQMPPSRFYAANVLSAVIWAPALVLCGDLLTRSLLGPENLSTKIFYITLVAVAVTVLAFWIRRWREMP
jgi:membrane protein DedA with SNARE-associated domain